MLKELQTKDGKIVIVEGDEVVAVQPFSNKGTDYYKIILKGESVTGQFKEDEIRKLLK